MPVPIEVLASAVALGGAALGYAFREYRNRARPFLQITGINGETMKRDDRTTISKETSDKLNGTFYLGQVEANTALGALHDAYTNIRRMAQFWPEDQPSITALLAANDDDSMLAALPGALVWQSVEEWLLTLTVGDRIAIPTIAATGLQEKVPAHDDDENHGQVWFVFPKKAVRFGNHLSMKVIRAKCQPFIDAVRFLHIPTLKDVFARFKAMVEAEYQIALECRPEVTERVNEQSRWVFYCYLANLSRTPIVIENAGWLQVRDKTRVRYREACYLALMKKEEETVSLRDTSTPLVVRGGDDAQFAFITVAAQSGMKLGKALRECFERGESRSRLALTIRRVGLFKTQSYRTSWVSFSAPKKLEERG